MHLIGIENYTLVNSYGLEKRFIEILRRLDRYFETTVIVSKDLADYLNRNGIYFSKLITTQPYAYKDKRPVYYVLFIWILRVLKTI